MKKTEESKHIIRKVLEPKKVEKCHSCRKDMLLRILDRAPPLINLIDQSNQ